MEIIVTPETVSYDVIAGICDAADYAVTTLDDGSLRIGAATTVFVRLSPKHDRMQVATYRGFTNGLNSKDRSEFMRSVNDENPLLKARLSNTGAFMISYEHCLVGGVTAENLLAVIERTAVLCADFMVKHAGRFK